jgi:hypothetical protein
MKQSEIIAMARQAGFIDADWNIRIVLPHLEAFAKLVAQHEREACAQFIETGYVRQFENPWRDDLSAAIRARGNDATPR